MTEYNSDEDDYWLTLSSLVVSNGYTSKRSRPYWSNTRFDIRALWRSGLSAECIAECQKVKKGGLDQYVPERFGIDQFLPQSEKSVGLKRLKHWIVYELWSMNSIQS